MTSERKNDIMRFLLYCLYTMFTFTCIVTFFVVGPKLEASLNPVVRGFSITEMEAQKGKTVVSGVMEKLRGECVIRELNVTVSGYSGDPEIAKFVEVHLEAEQNVVRNRPAGSQYWGPWTLYVPEKPIGPIVTISALHSCHILWNVRTVLWTGLTRDVFPIDYGDNP